MLTRIAIENFKGIGERIEIPLAPITLLFGPNSAGKSSVIHAIHYAYEVFVNRNLSPDRTTCGGVFVDLGGFQSFVHGHDPSTDVTLAFQLSLGDHSLPEYLQAADEFVDADLITPQVPESIHTANVSIRIGIDDLSRSVRVAEYAVDIDGEFLAKLETDSTGVLVTQANVQHPVLRVRGPYPEGVEIAEDWSWLNVWPDLQKELGQRGICPVRGQVDALPNWGEHLDGDLPLPELPDFWQFDEDSSQRRRFDDPIIEKQKQTLATLMRELLTRLITGPGEIVRNELSRLRDIGPIRTTPPRNFRPQQTPDVGRWATGLAAWDWLYHADAEDVEQVSDKLEREDCLNAGYRIERRDYAIIPDEHLTHIRAIIEHIDVDDALESLSLLSDELDDLEKQRFLRLIQVSDAGEVRVHPHDVGVGISQIIPVVVAAHAKGASLTAIEQPGLHLHPPLQVNLAELFITRAQEEPGTVLLETHSEHFLLRLLRRIRETNDQELPPDHPGLTADQLSVIYIEPGPRGVVATSLRVDAKGEFINRWPRGFFEERAEELF